MSQNRDAPAYKENVARGAALVQSDEQLRSETGRPREVHRRFVTYRVDELHPHPSYVRHQLTVPASKLSALAERGDLALQEPLVITRERTIIDGYDRWELARLQGRVTLPCIEYDLTEADSLRWLLQRHRHSKGLNDFIRVLLALELEHLLKEKAQSNQRVGGQNKGSSKLTKAEKLDVRSEIAAAASVSVGNVTKVKQVITTACAELQDALRNGEVSIHRAWLWREMSLQAQRHALMQYRGERGVRKTIRGLVSKHASKIPTGSAFAPELGSLARRFSQLPAPQLSSVAVAVVKVPGKAVFVTEELLQILEAQGELPIPWVAESH